MARSEYRISMLQSLSILKRAPTMEKQLKRNPFLTAFGDKLRQRTHVETDLEGADWKQREKKPALRIGFHDVTTGTPARVPQSFSALFSIVKVLVLISCACARRLRALLEIPVADDSTTASLTVRCPQRYLFLFFFMETRGKSETYKKDGIDKDYTTNTQRFNI
ncbi:hypothetical protein TNCV_2119211 [Trichonephila clavipes]|nr:hypothetical protein TNCV_2119211 [Trichonephila clavipes]